MDTTHSTAACSKCKQCGRILTKDEIGLHKKLYNRGATSYFALTAAANILRFPFHFFKRKLKNLRRWDARCFFEPPGQVRWLNICP